MATKPLKTLTFEGLDDTYTVPQIDASLSTTGKAADAKATGDSLAEKASSSGMVDMAKSLVGGKYTSDKQPYHFRKSPSGGAKDEVIVGGSLGWNQLCNASSVTVQSGHKYFMNKGGTESIGASDGTALTGLTSGTDTVIDLTILFGSTIADYIYSLETTTAGAGIAFVKRYLDLDTYHEYDAGSIQSVEGLVSHDVVGKNLCNVSNTEIGTAWNGSPNTARARLVIPCTPSTTYILSINGTNSMEAVFSSDGASVPLSQAGGSFTTTKTFTTGANSHYIVVAFSKTAIKQSDVDALNLQLELGSVATQYEPYEKHSYPLDSSITLRGVPKLVTDHIEFDGDKFHADGSVERRYWIVDLGSLEWTMGTETSPRFVCYDLEPVGAQTPFNNSDQRLLFSNNYFQNTAVWGPTNTLNGTAGIYSNGGLYIRDTTYSTAAAFKTAMSGVYLVYELATPTTESAQPFQSPMIVGSTEEYISDSVVPVGHESRYYEDIIGKVNNLPSDFSTLIAPVEKSFTATRNYTVGSFVIVNNQLYKVTSAISSGGTITPNSNCTATTIMAEILALA